ncbi:VUT family protein [Streptomyces tubercidicus]|uniref:VUT family protein n=1 Tax=Streptomyces tubercidicus TaxID=47759 RepID=UPI0036BCBE43
MDAEKQRPDRSWRPDASAVVSAVSCTVWALVCHLLPAGGKGGMFLPHRDRKQIVKLPAPAGIATLLGYVATIPAANLAVTHFGAVPVGFGYAAPAGVYMVGLALVLRDLAREAAGRKAVLGAIAVGTVVSYFLASPGLAVASAAAFAVAETMDFVIYEPLRSRGLVIAMLASNAIGLLADSLLFLKLAFGSFAYLPGQILGKAWMTLAAVAVLTILRRRKRATA